MIENFTLGLDIGVASVGWAVIQPKENKLVDMGVRLFEKANPAADSRKNRSARRNARRKVWRKEQLKKAFINFNLISEADFQTKGFEQFTTNNENLKRPLDKTVHHLRKRGLNEQITLRELYLCLNNICQTRGNFLYETVDFERDEQALDFNLFRQRFYELCSLYIEFVSPLDEFENLILSKLYVKNLKATELRTVFKNYSFTVNDTDEKLRNILLLLLGNKADIDVIDENLCTKEISGKIDVKTLLNKDDIPEYLQSIIDLHDLIIISNLLHDCNYICELNVKKLDNVIELYKLQYTDPESFKEQKKNIQSVMSGVIKHPERIRVIRNLENKFPNGLYVKEAKAILRKQQEFNPKITNAFIEIVAEIISARIPYYVGPLGDSSTNGWIAKTGKFEYSYNYSKKNALDLATTMKTWKQRMISRCTYLPEEYALPKGSFVSETFALINELNILKANQGSYQLTKRDKIKVFNELFLMGEGVSYKQIVDLLGLESFGTANNNQARSFVAKYSLYPSIVKIDPSLKLESIEEIFINTDKINRLEELILNISLFEDSINLKQCLMDEMGYDEVTASKLSKLNTKGFNSFSKKFIMETPLNQDGDSMLEILFENNQDNVTNEQMTIIANATDYNGNPLNLESNKYLKKFDEHPYMDINLLMKDGNPLIPISRPVIRALNETFKVYNEILNTYGVPERVVIETARDLLGDETKKGKESVSKSDAIRNMYNSLLQECKQQKKKGNSYVKFDVVDWDELEQYISSNQRKIELYIQQNGKDLITGESINIHKLQDYEIDHILPRGFGDNSMKNLMLIHRVINGKKADRLPIEFFETDRVETVEGNHHVLENEYVNRVKQLHEMKLIDEDKMNRLLLTSSEQAMGFINRDLVDTRYIIRELTAIFKAFNKHWGYPTHVVSLKSSFTTSYRNLFNMRKIRDVGDQHHAHDAAIVAIADACMSRMIPHYDERNSSNDDKCKNYHDFLENMKKSLNTKDFNEKDKFKETLRWGYYKAFGDFPTQNGSLINQVKELKPCVSYKVNKHYQGQFFDAKLYKPTTDESNVLSILGVNNNERSFSSINCVAVDFFKYTDKKGNRKHAAVHIPKCIINSNGSINKQKYLLLIKEHYKYDELLDENGNLKEHLFRIRLFKNNLYFDTENNQLMIYNIGSIVNKKTEILHPMIFSWNEISLRAKAIKESVIKQFDIKDSYINKNGLNSFKEIKIELIRDFIWDCLIDCRNKESFIKGKDILNNGDSYDVMSYAALLEKQLARKLVVPSVFGQNNKTANSIDGDAQYCKVVSTVLGVREHNDGTISGPRFAENKYSVIKKEPFYWTISKSMVE